MLVGVCALTACSKTSKTSRSPTKSDSAAAAAAAAAASAAAAAADQVIDPRIIAILDIANAADSAAGSLASEKGTFVRVRDFGRMMARDHHAIRKAFRDLAATSRWVVSTAVADSSYAGAMRWQDSLRTMARGANWDAAYIDHEVAYHAAILQTTSELFGATSDTTLNALIRKESDMMRPHVAAAISIQMVVSARPPVTPEPRPDFRK